MMEDEAIVKEEQAPEAEEPFAADPGAGNAGPRPELKKVLEALLFASPEPLAVSRLAVLASDGEGEANREEIARALAELEEDYRLQGRAFELFRVGGGYRFQSRREFAPYIGRMFNPRRYSRLSQATLETLAIVAYKQPITKAEIEAIRGVNVDGVIKTLLDRELIKVVGQKEVLGRPYLYGTDRRFLEHFGLRSLSDLPLLEEKPEGKPRRIEDASRLKPEPSPASPALPEKGDAPPDARLSAENENGEA